MSGFAAHTLRLCALVFLVVLGGCGGGGGGGGGDTDSSGDYSISPTSLSFSATENGDAPSAKVIDVAANSGTVFIDVVTAGPISAQLQINGATATILVTPSLPSNVGVGVHTGTVTVYGYKDPLGNIPAAGSPKVVNVTYTVTSGLAATPGSLNLLQIEGEAAPTAQLSLSDTQGGSYAWNASVVYHNGSGWLRLNGGAQASGTTLPAQLDVSIQTPASFDTYSATIRLTGNGRTFEVPVTFTYRQPQISVSPSFLSFESIVAGAAPATRQVTITGEDIDWTVSANQPWVQPSVTNGTGPGTFDIGIDTTGLSAGVHTATVTVTDTVSGAPRNVAVTLRLEPRRLQVSDDGVAFTSAPTIERLSHTVTVSENSGNPVDVTVSSSEAWLTAVASGTAPGTITLTADPTGLATEQIHYATVTVSSPDASVSNTEIIRVGFYVSALPPVAAPSVLADVYNVIADPIRPYVYLTNRRACSGSAGSGSGDNVVRIYNIYTGASVGTFTGPAGSELSEMAIASDGSRLYVLDSETGQIVPIDLDTGTVGSVWDPLGSFALTACADLEYARINGHKVVITHARHILNAETGASVGTFEHPLGAPSLWTIAASGNGENLFAIDTDDDLVRYAMSYSHVSNQLRIARTHVVSRSFNRTNVDLATNATGSRVYVANFVGGGIYTFDGTTLSSTPVVSGPNFVSTVEVGPSGKVYAGEAEPGTDLWIYDESDNLVGSHTLPRTAFARQLVVSGDGLRIAAVTLSTQGFVLDIMSTSP